jgi:hypothetical protein
VNLLKPTQLRVATENDVVLFSVGSSNPARFSYSLAFRIAQGLRVAGNVAARLEGIPKDERQMLKRSTIEPVGRPLLGLEERHTDERPSGIAWRVDVEGSLVAWHHGNVTMRFEAPDALAIAGMIRTAAKRAKHWANDTSITLRVGGQLSDAAENDRLGAV